MPKEIKLGDEIKTMYDTHELADLFGVTYRTVQRYLAQGKLKGEVMLAGKWHFSADNVKSFLEGQTDTNGNE